MKLGLFVLFLSFSIFTFSETTVQAYEPLDVERVVADLDTIKMEMDSTFFYINATYDLLKETVKLYGLKKTIQMNSDLFIPFVVFCALFFWAKKNRN